MLYQVVTNNEQVFKEYPDSIWVEGDFRDVLIQVRDLIHKGYRLITHPLPPSSRMFYSPIRSIIISKDPGPVDEKSVQFIGESIEMYDKHLGDRTPDFSNAFDYALIDQNLLEGGFAELRDLIHR